jgi:3',5'-cyclic AMP phosphodiesterase CpdA
MAGLVLALALPLFGAGPAGAHSGHVQAPPPWQEASPWPDRIVLTFAGDPARTLAVSWRTDDTVAEAVAEIVRAAPDARFDLAARAFPAETERLDLAQVAHAGALYPNTDNEKLPAVRYHSVVFQGLEPDTLYAYRVRGAQGQWSEWFQARTAPRTGPISFIYLGDAQNGILSHWARTVRAAYQKAPDARFILHAGDLVDKASRDFEWAQWFKAVGFIHGMTPAIPVAGNHEYFRVGLNPATAQRMLSVLWRPQFRLPVEPGLPEVLRETVYAVRYSDDLEVFVLDTQGGELGAQATWLDARLKASTARWKVATFHHPIFSSARGRDEKERRATLLPVLQKHDVDLVLQGHDHTYARGAIPQTPERVASPARAGDGVRTMFVNSVSGAKQYQRREGGWDDYASFGVRLDRGGENTQFFQVIRIDGRQLSYEAFTADGQLYDAFTLDKSAGGAKRLVKGRSSTMAERRFDGTGAYKDPDGL